MRRLVSDAPISVSAPQPTMVKHISETIRTMLSSTPLQDAVIAKTVEKPDMVTFSVKGEADYFWLLNTIASLRQTSYMMRLSEITTEGLTDGAVRYSFLVEAGIKLPE